MKQKKRIPVDKDRCQAYIEESFMALGAVQLFRCDKAPVYIATESKPGKDGLRGSMSLCRYCTGGMIRAMGEDHATLEII